MPRKNFLSTAQVNMIIADIGDEILARFSVEDIVAHFGADRLLNRFSPDEILPYLSVEDIVSFLSPKQRKQLRRLLEQ